MGRIVYANGSFVPEEAATVSIFDRGFLFADGVYEVVPVYAGRLIDKAPFLERLDNSLRQLAIAWPCSQADYVAFHEELIARNHLEEGIVYSQVTRGAADRDFGFPQDARPSVVAFTQKKSLVDSPLAQTGVKVASVPDIRWKRRDIKSVSLLAQVLAKQQAIEKGATEGWMVEDGLVTEGTSSTAYIVKDGLVITRPLSNVILPGIRRRVLMGLAGPHRVPIEQRPFTIEEAYRADEAMLSSASSFIMPVVEIDGRVIGSGRPGPMARRLRDIYIEAALKEAGVT